MGKLQGLLKRGSSASQGLKTGGTKTRKRQPSQLTFTGNHRASATSSVLQSLLTLYALIALMHGVVIPISDALAKPVEHAAYRQVFYIFMHGVGIVCIVYMNSLISWHNAKAKRKKKAEERKAAANASSSSSKPVTSEQTQPSKRETSPIGQRACHPDTYADPEAEIDENNQVPTPHGTPPLAADETADFDTDSVGREGRATLAARARLNGVASEVDLLELQPLQPPADGSAKQREHESEQQQLVQHQSQSRPRPNHFRHRQGRRKLERNPLVTDLPLTLLANNCGDHLAGASPESPVSPTSSTACVVRPITQSETGINLYLRLGSIVFGFGVMIHDGFKISEVIEHRGLEACQDIWFIPKQTVHLLFIMVQTYYLFKNHRVAFNTQLPLIRFMTVHLAVTNLCIWVKTVIYEIKVGLTEYHHGSHTKVYYSNKTDYVIGFASNVTALQANVTAAAKSSHAGCMEQVLEGAPSQKLGPYLYPCAVEYGLICAAMCYKIFTKIGDTTVMPYGQKMYPEGPRFTACHKSHKGLFLGLFIMICILVPLISLQLLKSIDKDQRGLYMLVVLGMECAVLAFTSAMAVLGTSMAVRHLKLYHVRGNEAFDVNLLFVGLAGILCYNLFVSVSVGSCALDTSNNGHCPRWEGTKNLISKVGGLKAVLEVAQSILQTLFIMQSIQRRITMGLVARNHKPGRGITIGLLIANLAMWIEAVFEAKSSFAEDFLQEYFGAMAWSIVKYIFLPLIIFYRFHSSVCLSEIWIHSYKMPKKHHRAGEWR